MSLGHGASIVRDGLVLHLDAANSRSYTGTGTTWSDLSGNEYNSVLTNTPTYSTSQNGYFILDGVNDYIATPYNMTNKINVTFTAWIKVLSYPIGKNDIIFDQTTGAVGCLFMILPTGYLQGAAYNSSGSAIGNISSLQIPLNQWKMISVSFENQKINYYMNLDNAFIIPINTIDVIKADNTNTMRIGTTVDGNTAYENLNAHISDIRVYEKVLTETEIKQNFEALRGRYGI
jgi:hypothetical protein